MGEEGVLLGFIKTVNFVDEEDGADFQVPVGLGAGDDGFDIAFLGGDGGDFDKVSIKLVGEDAGESGLAGAGGTPEDEVDRFLFLDDFGEDFAIANNFVLADDFF